MKPKQILFFLLIFGICGYFREFLFVNTNKILYMKYYNQNTYEHEQTPAVLSPMLSLSYNTLYYSKYLFTIIWSSIFFGLSYYAIKKLTNNKQLIKILIYAYLILFALSAVSMMYGYLINNRLQNDEYTLSRWLMGIAQSPIICLILLALEKLSKKTVNHDK